MSLFMVVPCETVSNFMPDKLPIRVPVSDYKARGHVRVGTRKSLRSTRFGNIINRRPLDRDHLFPVLRTGFDCSTASKEQGNGNTEYREEDEQGYTGSNSRFHGKTPLVMEMTNYH